MDILKPLWVRKSFEKNTREWRKIWRFLHFLLKFLLEKSLSEATAELKEHFKGQWDLNGISAKKFPLRATLSKENVIRIYFSHNSHTFRERLAINFEELRIVHLYWPRGRALESNKNFAENQCKAVIFRKFHLLWKTFWFSETNLNNDLGKVLVFVKLFVI